MKKALISTVFIFIWIVIGSKLVNFNIYILFTILFLAINLFFILKWHSSKSIGIIRSRRIKIRNLNRLVDNLKAKNWRLEYFKEGEFYRFKTKISLYSFGEIIEIKKLDSDDFEITSRPLLNSTIIDYNKNERNIEFIIQEAS